MQTPPCPASAAQGPARPGEPRAGDGGNGAGSQPGPAWLGVLYGPRPVCPTVASRLRFFRVVGHTRLRPVDLNHEVLVCDSAAVYALDLPGGRLRLSHPQLAVRLRTVDGSLSSEVDLVVGGARGECLLFTLAQRCPERQPRGSLFFLSFEVRVRPAHRPVACSRLMRIEPETSCVAAGLASANAAWLARLGAGRRGRPDDMDTLAAAYPWLLALPPLLSAPHRNSRSARAWWQRAVVAQTAPPVPCQPPEPPEPLPGVEALLTDVPPWQRLFPSVATRQQHSTAQGAETQSDPAREPDDTPL